MSGAKKFLITSVISSYLFISGIQTEFERLMLDDYPLPCVLRSGAITPEQKDYIRVYVDRLIKDTDIGTSYKDTLLEVLTHLQLSKCTCSTQYTSPMLHICGHIYTNYSVNATWNIHSLNGYDILLIFKQFDMIYSKNCSINSLRVIRIATACQGTESYCGHLLPWNETSVTMELSIVLEINEVISYIKLDIDFYIMKSKSTTIHKHLQFFRPDYPSMIRLQTWNEKMYKISILTITHHGKLIFVGFHNHTWPSSITVTG